MPEAPFLGDSNTAPHRNPSICRGLRLWGLTGWWRRTRRHFSLGRHTRVASCTLQGRPWGAGRQTSLPDDPRAISRRTFHRARARFHPGKIPTATWRGHAVIPSAHFFPLCLYIYYGLIFRFQKRTYAIWRTKSGRIILSGLDLEFSLKILSGVHLLSI